jgi:hypothetical protein
MESDTDDRVKLDCIRCDPVLAVCKIEEAQALQGHRFRRRDECRSGGRCGMSRSWRRLHTELCVERLPSGGYLLAEETARSQRGWIRNLSDHGIALIIGYYQMVVAV